MLQNDSLGYKNLNPQLSKLSANNTEIKSYWNVEPEVFFLYSWHRFEYAQKVGQSLRDMRKPYWEDEHHLDRWMCLEKLTREKSRRLPKPGSSEGGGAAVLL